MTERTINSHKKALDSGNLKMTDLVSDYLARISRDNPGINAFTLVQEDLAMQQAREIQTRLESGESGSLAGTVMGIKDLLCHEGVKATCASRMLRNYKAVYTATVLEKLISEDAVIIGRLNMDEFAMGSSTENTIYGPARNPQNPQRVTGGSSGGSAAAVAAGLCTASLGTDTGGSIRQPASYCGVVGLKPTYGRVSRFGLIAYASSFDCIGPLATNVQDAAAILQVISGHDPRDATSSSLPVPDYLAGMCQPENGLRIGIPREYFGEGLDPKIKKRVLEISEDLERAGAILSDITLPHLSYAIATYYVLATAEASSNLARFDGIRYGHRTDLSRVRQQLREEEERLRLELQSRGTDPGAMKSAIESIDSPMIRLYKQSRTEGFGTEVKRRIMLGTYVLSAGYYEAYYGKAQRIRRLIKEDFQKAFSNVDVILSPTTPTTAFEIGANIDNPLQMYLNDVYTISANLAGICGISVPAGNHPGDGMPIGIQLMANAFCEPVLLNTAMLVESTCKKSGV